MATTARQRMEGQGAIRERHLIRQTVRPWSRCRPHLADAMAGGRRSLGLFTPTQQPLHGRLLASGRTIRPASQRGTRATPTARGMAGRAAPISASTALLRGRASMRIRRYAILAGTAVAATGLALT